MNTIRNTIFLILISTFSHGQEKPCPLGNYEVYSSQSLFESDRTTQVALARPDNYLIKTDFLDGAPINNVGYIHNDEDGVFCSGYFYKDYGITSSWCAKKMLESGKITTFTLKNKNGDHNSAINRVSYFNNLGVFTLYSYLPYEPTTLRSDTYSEYINKKGWIIRGYASNRDYSKMTTQDNCRLTYESGKTYDYSCSENSYFKPGSVIMGKLCGEWKVVGFKSTTSSVHMIDSDDLNSALGRIGLSCDFSSAKPCSLTEQKPFIDIDNPKFWSDFNKDNQKYFGDFNKDYQKNFDKEIRFQNLKDY